MGKNRGAIPNPRPPRPAPLLPEAPAPCRAQAHSRPHPESTRPSHHTLMVPAWSAETASPNVALCMMRVTGAAWANVAPAPGLVSFHTWRPRREGGKEL